MKPVIFGVVAFVLGLGGSTGVMVLTTPVRLTAADSLVIARADTSHAAHAAAAAPVAHAARAVTAPVPVVHEAPAPPPVVVPPATTVASTAAATAPVVTHVPDPVVVPAHPARPANSPDADSYKQVGSILLNMKPTEAARIVSYLNDDQVEGLLRSMSPRQAAGVLAQLAPERGAVLSRRLLVPAKEARP
jgi:hypothetical protein